MSIFEQSSLAERAFYQAFEDKNLDAMMAVWLEQGNLCCIHPGGERLQTWSEIRASWAAIFANDIDMRIETLETKFHLSEGVAIHYVKEQIHIAGVRRGLVVATNVYSKQEGSWKMIAHHASPSPSRPQDIKELH